MKMDSFVVVIFALAHGYPLNAWVDKEVISERGSVVMTRAPV